MNLQKLADIAVEKYGLKIIEIHKEGELVDGGIEFDNGYNVQYSPYNPDFPFGLSFWNKNEECFVDHGVFPTFHDLMEDMMNKKIEE